MNAILRHYALRLFATALVGTLINFGLLPYAQWIPSGTWVALPVALVLAGCFFALGWGMNRLGLSLIRRQIAESAAWERAGMASEAKSAFDRVKSLFDSFWLSALARQQNTTWITMRLARFFLTQARPTREGLAMVTYYLHLHPRDEAVAIGWLEAVLRHETATPEEQELAAGIGEALSDNETVQRLLMQFFLAHRRVDFEAVQTYRRVWQLRAELPETMTRELGRVLLNEAFIDDWALQVYLKAYDLGEIDCLEGIVAGLQFLRPNVDNGRYLAVANKIISQLDESQRQELILKFPAPQGQSRTHARRISAEPFKAAGRSLASMGVSYGSAFQKTLHFSFNAVKSMPGKAWALWRQSSKVRWGVNATILTAAGAVFLVVGWQWIGAKSKRIPVPTPAASSALPVNQSIAKPVTDPFTIQVAAYLKSEDAQRFVDRLKQNDIEAFSNKAVSANRIWYQVKVSHFATKDEAVKYGEMLKAKGLIDDFYVANYSQSGKM